jgi:hypothetical protein
MLHCCNHWLNVAYQKNFEPNFASARINRRINGLLALRAKMTIR